MAKNRMQVSNSGGKSDKIEEAVDKKLRRFSNNNPAIIQKFIPKIPNGFRKQQRKKEK
jgi:hypothetical protein